MTNETDRDRIRVIGLEDEGKLVGQSVALEARKKFRSELARRAPEGTGYGENVTKFQNLSERELFFRHMTSAFNIEMARDGAAIPPEEPPKSA